MRTSQQADIFTVVPNPNYNPTFRQNGGNNERTSQAGASGANSNSAALIVPLGFAQSIKIDDNFNAQAVNVLGAVSPIIHPGYPITTISIEKATIDGYSFRNLGGFNPLWAHIGESYMDDNLVNISIANSMTGGNASSKMYPFMFILAIKDRVSNSFEYSNFPELNTNMPESLGKADSDDYTVKDTDNATANLIGTYVCVINTASTSLQANNAIIMDNISAYARPLNGTWMNKAMREALSKYKNGMDDDQFDPLYGYNSKKRTTS